MDDMKISFNVEITGCLINSKRCPYLTPNGIMCLATPFGVGGTRTATENMHQLTKTCPMVRAQFEALE